MRVWETVRHKSKAEGRGWSFSGTSMAWRWEVGLAADCGFSLGTEEPTNGEHSAQRKQIGFYGICIEPTSGWTTIPSAWATLQRPLAASSIQFRSGQAMPAGINTASCRFSTPYLPITITRPSGSTSTVMVSPFWISPRSMQSERASSSIELMARRKGRAP